MRHPRLHVPGGGGLREAPPNGRRTNGEEEAEGGEERETPPLFHPGLSLPFSFPLPVGLSTGRGMSQQEGLI